VAPTARLLRWFPAQPRSAGRRGGRGRGGGSRDGSRGGARRLGNSGNGELGPPRPWQAHALTWSRAR
jgi:hypothetical protein